MEHSQFQMVAWSEVFQLFLAFILDVVLGANAFTASKVGGESLV